MTPEQQKLIQQLLHLGDVKVFNRKKESIVEAITAMDLVSLELILDENLTYEDASKEMFLTKLKEIFDEFEKNKDTLLAHSGKCDSKECTNHNKNGVLFCGRNSGKHFNLIIEEDDNENVKDLFYCFDFKCNFEGKVNQVESLTLKIYDDEKVNFIPSSHYNYMNSTSLKAISDLNNYKNTTISKNEILDWLQEYYDFFSSMSFFRIRYKNANKFYYIYDRAYDLKKYLIIEKDCAAAVQLYDNLLEGYEMNMIKWLAEHEQLKDELMLLSPEFVDENTNRLKKIIVNHELNISINLDYLKNCIRFQDIIETHYYVMFDKFKVEIEGEKNFSPFDDDIDKQISLKYHLEQRNIFPNEINYKTKLGKNSFLYVNDGLGKLDEGIN